MYPLKNTDEALIYQGRITAVHPLTMTADIYIPEINNEYRGVYLLTDSIQTTYGTITMPEVDSLGLIVLYHRSKQPVIMGFIPPYKFNSGGQVFEYLKEGECQTSAKGGGYFKGDIAGNAIVGGNEMSADMHLPDSSKFSVFLGESEISNFHKNDLHIDYNSDIITIGKTFEYHKDLDLGIVPTADILKDGKLDRSIIEKVLKDARDVIKQLDDDESIFSLTSSIMSRVSDHTIKKSDVDEYAENLNDYILPASSTVVKGEMFGNNILSVSVKKDGDLVAGIEIDENGGRLTGRWDV